GVLVLVGSWVVAVQRPVAALDGVLLVTHRGAHLDAVGDARAVGDDERRSVPRLGFGEGLDRLDVVAAHCDLGHVDVAVRHGQQPQILLAGALAVGGELGYSTARRGLGGLPAGVRVHLGIEYQDVDVATRCQHVIEATGPDVVSPPVAPDDPYALVDQLVSQRQQPRGVDGG